MAKLSLAMIVKDEEKYLDRCLKSSAKMVDEIVVVDTGSSDNTKQIALDHGARVYDFQWCNDFAAARNYSIEQTTGDWVLVMDADEYFTEDCSDIIQSFMKDKNRIGSFESVAGYILNGQIHHARYYVSRLFPRTIRYKGRIHEQIDSELPRKTIEGVRILHDGYYDNNKSERNLPLLHMALDEHPNDPYILYQIGKQYREIDNKKAEYYLSLCYESLILGKCYIGSAVIELVEVLTQSKNFELGLEVIRRESKHLAHSPDFQFASALFYLDYALDTQDYSVIKLIEACYRACLELGKLKAEEMVIGTSTYLAAYNLGVFYETTGSHAQSRECYALAASYGYEPAKRRL